MVDDNPTVVVIPARPESFPPFKDRFPTSGNDEPMADDDPTVVVIPALVLA